MPNLERLKRNLTDTAFETVGRISTSRMSPLARVESLAPTRKRRSSACDASLMPRRTALVATAAVASAAGSLPFFLSAQLGKADTASVASQGLGHRLLADPNAARPRFVDSFLEAVEYADPEIAISFGNQIASTLSSSTDQQTRLSLFDKTPVDTAWADTGASRQLVTGETWNAPTPSHVSANLWANADTVGISRAAGSTGTTTIGAGAWTRQLAGLDGIGQPFAPASSTTRQLSTPINLSADSEALADLAMHSSIGGTQGDVAPIIDVPIPGTRMEVLSPDYVTTAAVAPTLPSSRNGIETTPVASAEPAAMTASTTLPSGKHGTPGVSSPHDKFLIVRNVHTGEQLKARFVKDGAYDVGALSELKFVFRDRRDGSARDIDPKLFDQIHALIAMNGRSTGTTQVNLVSGYRSPSTNALLRAHSSGVAKNSYHMQGRAVDLFIDGVQLSDVHIGALKLNSGGVGYYPTSNFVHLDTGPVRNWPASYRAMGAKIRSSV